MRMLLLVVSLCGFAVIADSRPTAAQAPGDQIQLTANSTARVGAMLQLRGDVRISDGSSVIIADEADVPVSGAVAAPPTIELRGNVHVTFEGHRPAFVEPAVK